MPATPVAEPGAPSAHEMRLGGSCQEDLLSSPRSSGTVIPCGRSGTGLMSSDTVMSSRSDQLDMGLVEAALAVLRRACDKAIDELGGAVPQVQLRALLVIDDAGGGLDLHRLAAELTASVSAMSRVCDRMQAAGLLTTEVAASSQAGARCVLTGSGRRLARWVTDRQRGAVRDVLSTMRPQARDALVHGLSELGAAAQKPS
jgi:DNA-binding MarR family transcriptional regulator